MISEKMSTREELKTEKQAGSITKYMAMLERNNRLLDERLTAALGFLELQEQYIPGGIVFLWREMTMEQ